MVTVAIKKDRGRGSEGPRMASPDNANSVRARIHHAVRRTFTDAVLGHYKQNPKQVDDERGQAGLKALLKLMDDTLGAIDVVLMTPSDDCPDAADNGT